MRVRGRDNDIQHHLAPHHQVRKFLGGGPGSLHLASHFARAKESDLIRKGHHVLELVRDQQHGLALGAKLFQVAKEIIRFLRGQHCGRLVQYQDVGLAIEQLEDLDALLHPDGKLLDRRARISRRARAPARSITRQRSGSAPRRMLSSAE